MPSGARVVVGSDEIVSPARVAVSAERRPDDLLAPLPASALSGARFSAFGRLGFASAAADSFGAGAGRDAFSAASSEARGRRGGRSTPSAGRDSVGTSSTE